MRATTRTTTSTDPRAVILHTLREAWQWCLLNPWYFVVLGTLLITLIGIVISEEE